VPIVVFAVKAVIGGLAVLGFSVIGEAARPKRFAGLFAAAPSVALASLAITVLSKGAKATRSEEHTSELQSPCKLVCRLVLVKKKAGAPPRSITPRAAPGRPALRDPSPGPAPRTARTARSARDAVPMRARSRPTRRRARRRPR